MDWVGFVGLVDLVESADGHPGVPVNCFDFDGNRWFWCGGRFDGSVEGRCSTNFGGFGGIAGGEVDPGGR